MSVVVCFVLVLFLWVFLYVFVFIFLLNLIGKENNTWKILNQNYSIQTGDEPVINETQSMKPCKSKEKKNSDDHKKCHQDGNVDRL